MSQPRSSWDLAGLARLGLAWCGSSASSRTDRSAHRPPYRITPSLHARPRQRSWLWSLSGYAWEDDRSRLAKREDVDVFVETDGRRRRSAKDATRPHWPRAEDVVSREPMALLAIHGQALAEQAEAAGLLIRYEARRRRGIPVINAAC